MEFALLAIPFLTILMAMLETGYFYFIAVLLEGATAEAGRQIRTGNIQQSAAPIEAFKEQLCNNMFNVVACNELRVDVRNFAQFSAANPPAIENNNGVVMTDCVTCNFKGRFPFRIYANNNIDCLYYEKIHLLYN